MKEVERKCIVTGEVKSKEELLRFTVTPDLEVVPDFKGKLPGKGIYVSNSKAALSKAIEKGLFAKAYKQNVKFGKTLVDLTESILRKKALESISLAKKAGVLITGFEKVVETIKKGKAAFVLEAKDGAKDGRDKIASVAKGLEIFVLYDVEELDKALDRVNTVHTVFVKSEMAKMVHIDFKRIENFLNS